MGALLSASLSSLRSIAVVASALRRAALALLLLGAALLTMPAPAAADRYEDGYAAYEAGDYKRAYQLWLPLAEQGGIDAQYAVGYLWEFGQGVKQSYVHAREWYERAAEADHDLAIYSLGYFYENGYGVRKDYGQAAHYYQRASDLGNVNAMSSLGYLYEFGYGVTLNIGRAVSLYRRAADGGDGWGAYALGDLYEQGKGVDRDLVQAYAMYSVALQWLSPGTEIYSDLTAAHDRVGNRLSSNQLAQAERIQRDFLASAEGGYAPEEDDYAGADSGGGSSGFSGGGAAAVDELVMAVQQALAQLGYLGGNIDGIMGPQTRSAIRAFQYDFGLQANGQITEELLEALGAALAAVDGSGGSGQSAAAEEPEPVAPSPDVPELVATGTGFVLNARGHVLTNYHVVEGCSLMQARLTAESPVLATVVAGDPGNDLALLVMEGGASDFATFRDGRAVRQAEDVLVIGYPLTGLLSSQTKVTTGTVSALAGIGDDTRFLQISAAVQPGNSGGPLLDDNGHVIGVIVSKLDAMSVAEQTGDIPQNINFAIKGLVARSFLDANDIEYLTAASDQPMATADIADQARKFTVLLECYQ